MTEKKLTLEDIRIKNAKVLTDLRARMSLDPLQNWVVLSESDYNNLNTHQPKPISIPVASSLDAELNKTIEKLSKDLATQKAQNTKLKNKLNSITNGLKDEVEQ